MTTTPGCRTYCIVVLVLSGCLVGSARAQLTSGPPLGGAAAEPATGRPHFGYEVRLLAALDPGAFNLGVDFFYRHTLYASSRRILANNEVLVQVGAGISPAAARPSVRLSVQPLSVLRVWIEYDGEGYFGASGYARSYESPSADYGRGLVSRPPTGPPGSTGSYALWVNKLELGARLQLQLGSWIFRTSWRGVRYETSLAARDRVLYEPWLDTLVYKHGWALQGDSDVGYELSHGGTVIGLRATVTVAFYPDAAYAPGEAHVNLNSPSVRVGPFARAPLLKARWKRRSLEQIFLTVLTQFYVVDRFRTGGTVPPAVPLLAVSLTAVGDL